MSVLIPTYNRGGLIGRAIDSVLGQRYTDWELIVVDDSSTDDTPRRLAAYSDPRIRTIVRSENGGAAAARNAGIMAAKGQLVAFLDSDDQWLPGALETLVAALDQDRPAADAVAAGFYLVRFGAAHAVACRPSSSDWFVRLLDGCVVAAGSALIVRRECFDTVGSFDEGLGRMEDWDWLLRFTLTHRLKVIPDLLAMIHVGPRPDARTIVVAATRLYERNAERILQRAGRKGLRRFRASLELNHAAAAFHANDVPRGLLRLLGMAGLSPARAGRFLADRLAEAAHARRKPSTPHLAPAPAAAVSYAHDLGVDQAQSVPRSV